MLSFALWKRDLKACALPFLVIFAMLCMYTAVIAYMYNPELSEMLSGYQQALPELMAVMDLFIRLYYAAVSADFYFGDGAEAADGANGNGDAGKPFGYAEFQKKDYPHPNHLHGSVDGSLDRDGDGCWGF